MTEKQTDQIVLPTNQIMMTELLQTAESELVEARSSIQQLQDILARLALYTNSETHMGTIIQTQATLKFVGEIISNILNLHRVQVSQKRIEIWENEGGRIRNDQT